MKGLKNPWVVSAINHAKLLHREGDHNAEVAYLEVVVREAASPEDKLELQHWLGRGFLMCTGRAADALVLYAQLVQQYEPRSANWIRTRSYLANSYSRLGAYRQAAGMMEELYQIAKGLREKLPDFDVLVCILVATQLQSARATYPIAGPGEHRICNRCMRVGQNLLACDCGRAWYCDVLCKEADCEVHIHPNFPMDRLPAVLVRHHIVPLCLAIRNMATGGMDPFSVDASRRCGLALRTLNSVWRSYIDASHAWWLDVVPWSWRREFRPTTRPTTDVVPMVLGLAYKQWRDTLQRRSKAISAKIRLLDKKRESRNEKLAVIKREVEDIDAEQQKERDTLESLQKKLKK